MKKKESIIELKATGNLTMRNSNKVTIISSIELKGTLTGVSILSLKPEQWKN